MKLHDPQHCSQEAATIQDAESSLRPMHQPTPKHAVATTRGSQEAQGMGEEGRQGEGEPRCFSPESEDLTASLSLSDPDRCFSPASEDSELGAIMVQVQNATDLRTTTSPLLVN